MTRLLVVYGTIDGHTAKIARALGETLREQGAVVDVAAPGKKTDPAKYDGVIVAGSVHAGGYPRALTSWVRKHARVLDARPTAFVSVCLGILQSDIQVHRELAAILRRFLRATGWHPTETKIVAGALLYTQYNWLKRWVMVRIVRKAGGDTDTTRDFDYTDWADLRGFAQQFAQRMHPAVAAAAAARAVA